MCFVLDLIPNTHMVETDISHQYEIFQHEMDWVWIWGRVADECIDFPVSVGCRFIDTLEDVKHRSEEPALYLGNGFWDTSRSVSIFVSVMV